MSGRPQIFFAVYGEHVEGVEVPVLASEQQSVEVASSGGRQAADFTIENCINGSEDARNLLGEVRPGFEDVFPRLLLMPRLARNGS